MNNTTLDWSRKSRNLVQVLKRGYVLKCKVIEILPWIPLPNDECVQEQEAKAKCSRLTQTSERSSGFTVAVE